MVVFFFYLFTKTGSQMHTIYTEDLATWYSYQLNKIRSKALTLGVTQRNDPSRLSCNEDQSQQVSPWNEEQGVKIQYLRKDTNRSKQGKSRVANMDIIWESKGVTEDNVTR